MAFRRAQIELYKFYRNKIKSRLEVLVQLYSSISTSKHFNEMSYESRRIRKEIYRYTSYLKDIKNLLKEEQKDLRLYIQKKDLLYQKLRAKRK